LNPPDDELDIVVPAVVAAGAQGAHADLCKCGNFTLVMEEGCKKCLSCGYSEC
jgi:ribonucleoside-diphosphate reductase alpha chain